MTGIHPDMSLLVPKRFPVQSQPSFGSTGQSRFGVRFPESDDPIRSMEFTITLQQLETGFGFRIIGGTEEGSQVSVGHIVPNGSADLDGRLRTGDEITHVDGQNVINSSHHHVVSLMRLAGQRGHVTLGVRRRVLGEPSPMGGGYSPSNNVPMTDSPRSKFTLSGSPPN